MGGGARRDRRRRGAARLLPAVRAVVVGPDSRRAARELGAGPAGAYRPGVGDADRAGLLRPAAELDQSARRRGAVAAAQRAGGGLCRAAGRGGGVVLAARRPVPVVVAV